MGPDLRNADNIANRGQSLFQIPERVGSWMYVPTLTFLWLRGCKRLIYHQRYRNGSLSIVCFFSFMAMSGMELDLTLTGLVLEAILDGE